MSKFDDYYNKFMGMHKARIIVEGQFQNIWTDTEGHDQRAYEVE